MEKLIKTQHDCTTSWKTYFKKNNNKKASEVT